MSDPVINTQFGQDGANRYAYVRNRPTALIDPSGFESEYVSESESTPEYEEVISVDAWVEDAPSMQTSNVSNDWFAESSSGAETYGPIAWEGTGPASTVQASDSAPLEEQRASATDTLIEPFVSDEPSPATIAMLAGHDAAQIVWRTLGG